jgi:DHA2 family multidrug resistance protein
VFGSFVIPLMLTGVGAALLFVPLTTAVLGGVPQAVGAKASAYTNLGIQLGGSVMIAALSTLLDRREAFHLNDLASAVTPAAPAIQMLPHAAQSVPGLFGLVDSQATIFAYLDISIAIAAIAFIAVPLVGLMPKPRQGAAIRS